MKIVHLRDSEHLQWIYDRLKNVYGENENYDYMIRLRAVIQNVQYVETERALGSRI